MGTIACQCPPWVFPALLAINLALTAGCAGKATTTRQATPVTGSACYAKALPTVGEGGLAWGSTLSIARKKSMDNCIRYAGRSGGTPQTCQVVLSECK
ncbi:hypothetical protein [Pseudomonas sp. NPDC089569]|uniref:hypothetical protein n=1 Tax=Pseudomonas sp. NPDC089569 TaxID=3390722 RepID=UPI003D019B01